MSEINHPISASERVGKLIREIGFPIVVALILLWDRITVFQKFTDIMTEVAVTLREVRDELPKGGHR